MANLGKIKLFHILLVVLGAGMVINLLSGEEESPPSSTAAAPPPVDEPEQPLPTLVTTGRADQAIAQFSLWGAPISEATAAAEPEAQSLVPTDPLSDNMFLIVDGSGSMSEVECSDGRQKIDVARDSILRFIDTIPPLTNLGLILFDSRGHNLWSGLETGNRDLIRDTIGLMQADGGTPLGHALEFALQEMRSQAAVQRGYGSYRVVIITDGLAGDEAKLIEVMDQMLDTPVTLYTIGFCIDDTHSLNIPGQTFYAAATSPEELNQGLDAVLAESTGFDVSDFAPGELQ